MTLTCFKAYDIRGKLGEEFNEAIVYRIGRAFGEWLKMPEHQSSTPALPLSREGISVVVGGDVRLTSVALKQAVANGLMDTGIDVIDLGVTGTEEIYFATFHLGVAGGIEITASHNPLDYNGMKLVKAGAEPLNTIEFGKLRELAEDHEFNPVTTPGTLRQCSCLPEYIQHLFTYVDLTQLRPLKLVVNAGNGTAGHVIDALELELKRQQIPLTFIKIYHEADGNFPHGIPNPLLPENRVNTSKAVIAHEADMGIAWDGDFDRCFFFDEAGSFIEGYYIVGLLAEAFLQRQPDSKIIHDPRLTWNTIDIVHANGGIPVQSKTGHAFIKAHMRAENAIYGGEMSAHHYFRDFAYCDSGMIPWLLLTQLVSVRKQPLSALVNERIQCYPCSGEINFKVNNVAACIAAVRSHYSAQKPLVVDINDGLTMEFEDWRFNLRASNTEPVLRLNVESRGKANLLRTQTQVISDLLRA